MLDFVRCLHGKLKMDHQPTAISRKNGATNLWLLVSLLLSLLVLPLVEGLYAGRALLLLGMTSTLILAAIIAHSRLRVISLVLLCLALPTAWATLFVQWKPLFVAHCLIGSAFFWIVGSVTVFLVLRNRVVTFDSVFGAICAYLMFGLAWAFSYWAIYTVTPDAFTLPEQRVSNGDGLSQVLGFSQFIYYSFVTMATLGYGDITPLGRITRTLAWMQTVVGQFYVAVVIAWLVSALPRAGGDTK